MAGCGDGGGGESARLPEGCAEVDAPTPKEEAASEPTDQLSGAATAVVETSCGSFEIELDAAISPKTTSSFASLAEQGFYDGTPFNRIQRGFLIQGGDPLGDRTGGPGYTIDEPPPEDLAYLRGTVAMAKNEAEPPGRSGSQFFIVTAAADAGLPPDYALLGMVTAGFDTVERIELAGDPSGADGAPVAPVVIERVTIEAG